MHRILQRQLGRFLADPKNIAPEWQPLLEVISDTYTHFDEDRALLDRSLDLSSKEFLANSRKLQEAKEKVEEIVKQRTVELRAEQARLLASIENLSLGFVMMDADGRILHQNSTFTALLGLTEADNVEETQSQLNNILKKIQHLSDTKTLLLNKKFLRIFLTPIILSSTAEKIGTVMVVEDATKEEQIDRAKSEFVTLASHQLRTPLTIIKWWAESLRRKMSQLPDLHLIQNYLNHIEEGTDRMVALVAALLDASRIEVGKLAIKPQQLDAVALCRTIVDELQTEITERKQQIKQAYNPNIPPILADPNLLRIIIQNLLTNAIKYTPEQGVITISLTKDNSFLVLTVSDTGFGIPKDQQSKIFTKLFRADNIKLTKTSGTGLGLYITKSVVEASGGTITFTSPTQNGSGTEFRVVLPIEWAAKNEGIALATHADENSEILYS